MKPEFKCLAVLGCLLLLIPALQSCALFATSKQVSAPIAPVPTENFNPEGEWIYEDKLVTGIADLDRNGNGSYPWKGGYFVSKGWEDGVWMGTWHQPGNDREGGFELYLSEDLSSGEGRWWFTRIGNDHSPTKRGGKFSLLRP